MDKRKPDPHPEFPEIERHHDLYKYCYGGHPLLTELSRRYDELRADLQKTLNGLREEERAAYERLVSVEKTGPGWRLVPANAECGKYYAEQYEDRDWVRFRCYRLGVPDVDAHRAYYGPVAEWRHSFGKIKEGENFSIVYWRTSTGKVKSDGGGYAVLSIGGRATFDKDFGVWTDEEWRAFKEQGIIPERFW